jgi:hypothetical protein
VHSLYWWNYCRVKKHHLLLVLHNPQVLDNRIVILLELRPQLLYILVAPNIYLIFIFFILLILDLDEEFLPCIIVEALCRDISLRIPNLNSIQSVFLFNVLLFRIAQCDRLPMSCEDGFFFFAKVTRKASL